MKSSLDGSHGHGTWPSWNLAQFKHAIFGTLISQVSHNFFLQKLFCFISEWDSKKQLTSYINPLGTARFRACAVDSLWVNRRWWQYKTTGDGGEGMRGV